MSSSQHDTELMIEILPPPASQATNPGVTGRQPSKTIFHAVAGGIYLPGLHFGYGSQRGSRTSSSAASRLVVLAELLDDNDRAAAEPQGRRPRPSPRHGQCQAQESCSTSCCPGCRWGTNRVGTDDDRPPGGVVLCDRTGAPTNQAHAT